MTSVVPKEISRFIKLTPVSSWQVVFPQSKLVTQRLASSQVSGWISWSRGCGFESHRWLVSLFLVRFLSISLSLISPWPGSSKSCNSANENFWIEWCQLAEQPGAKRLHQYIVGKKYCFIFMSWSFCSVRMKMSFLVRDLSRQWRVILTSLLVLFLLSGESNFRIIRWEPESLPFF